MIVSTDSSKTVVAEDSEPVDFDELVVALALLEIAWESVAEVTESVLPIEAAVVASASESVNNALVKGRVVVLPSFFRSTAVSSLVLLAESVDGVVEVASRSSVLSALAVATVSSTGDALVVASFDSAFSDTAVVCSDSSEDLPVVSEDGETVLEASSGATGPVEPA